MTRSRGPAVNLTVLCVNATSPGIPGLGLCGHETFSAWELGDCSHDGVRTAFLFGLVHWVVTVLHHHALPSPHLLVLHLALR